MVDPMHFEAFAASYADARPPYPPALWGCLRDLGALQPGLLALDLGAGTGQATGPMLAAGLNVTAVEPGEQLAERLRAAYPAASVLTDRAEDVELRSNTFDITTAATSVHWLDLGIVLPKVHRVLVAERKFLVWRNVFGDTSIRTSFRDIVEMIVQERDALTRPGVDPEDVSEVSSALTQSGLFAVDTTRLFRWSIELDDRQVFRLFSTFSDWTVEEAERAAAAVREVGGSVVEHYVTWLIALTATPV